MSQPKMCEARVREATSWHTVWRGGRYVHEMRTWETVPCPNPATHRWIVSGTYAWRYACDEHGVDGRGEKGRYPLDNTDASR